MWPPGAYKGADRVPLTYPPYGTLKYFDQTAASVLDRIKSYRGTTILPAQTGPVNDVLYSAAGNSADEAYYNHGIIGYDFEIGAAHYYLDTGDRDVSHRRDRLPAVLRRGRHRRRPGHCPATARSQRGPRRGHGVRQRQLRAARVGARLPAGHKAPTVGLSGPTSRPRRSTSASPRTRRRRSTTRPTARRRPPHRRSTSRTGRGRCPSRSTSAGRPRSSGWPSTSRATSPRVQDAYIGTQQDGNVGGTTPARCRCRSVTRRVRRVHAGPGQGLRASLTANVISDGR
jgi:hypothetical protein